MSAPPETQSAESAELQNGVAADAPKKAHPKGDFSEFVPKMVNNTFSFRIFVILQMAKTYEKNNQ